MDERRPGRVTRAPPSEVVVRRVLVIIPPPHQDNILRLSQH
jgi:hypothetical protein